MKLYSLPLSPYAARVRCAIYARQAPVEIAELDPDWRTNGQISRLNPMNRIPVLVLDDGTALPESAVILDYLDRALGLGLVPADPLAAARARLVCQVIDSYVNPAMWPLFMALDPKAGFDAEKNAGLYDALQTALGYLQAAMDDGPYASGGAFTIADAYAMPQHFNLTTLAGLVGRPDLLAPCPRLAAYAQTIEAEPGLARVQGEMSAAREAFLRGWRETGDPAKASVRTHT